MTRPPECPECRGRLTHLSQLTEFVNRWEFRDGDWETIHVGDRPLGP